MEVSENGFLNDGIRSFNALLDLRKLNNGTIPDSFVKKREVMSVIGSLQQSADFFGDGNPEAQQLILGYVDNMLKRKPVLGNLPANYDLFLTRRGDLRNGSISPSTKPKRDRS